MKVVQNVLMDLEVNQKLKDFCKEKNVSFSSFIQKAVEEALQK